MVGLLIFTLRGCCFLAGDRQSAARFFYASEFGLYCSVAPWATCRRCGGAAAFNSKRVGDDLCVVPNILRGCFFSRSTFLNLTLLLFVPAVALSFKSYCPVRAALTFVDCDKSKQKRAFGSTRRSAVAVNFSASPAFITVNTSPLIPPP